MLEVVQEHVQGEGGRIPHDEALAGGTPGDDPVQPRLADEIVRLGQEWWQLRPLQQCLHGPRWRDQVMSKKYISQNNRIIHLKKIILPNKKMHA